MKGIQAVPAKVLLCCSLLLILFGCHPQGTWDEKRIRGKIREGRYYEPLGLCSVKTPPFTPPTVIKEATPGTGMSFVNFQDSTGNSIKVEVYQGLFDKNVIDTDGRKAEKSFLSIVFPRFKGNHPLAKKTFGEIILEEDQKPLYFAVIKEPERGPRGMGVFLDHDRIIALSYATFLPVEEENNFLREKVLEIRHSYRNELPYTENEQD